MFDDDGDMTALPLDTEPDDQSALLRWVAQHRRSVMRSEAATLAAAVTWAAFHSTGGVVGPFESWEQGFLPLAGEGTPEVAEFSIAEFAAVLGRSTDAGRTYIGDALELAHRLPRIYARTQDDSLEVWRARQIAQATRCLTPEGAAHVDRARAPMAHKVGKVTIDRLLNEAMARFDPEQARQRAAAAAESRRVDVHRDDLDHAGLADISATVDLADADDFEAAIARRAAHLGEQGDTDSLDVRRAKALGQMARADLGLDLESGSRTGGAGVSVELRVHVNADDLDTALTGTIPPRCRAGTRRADPLLHRLRHPAPLALPARLEALRASGHRHDVRDTRRPVRDPRAAPPPGHRARRPLRLPALHAPRAPRRHRPRRAVRLRRPTRPDQCRQPRSALPQPPPPQDLRRLELHDARARLLPVAHSPRSPAAGHAHRHGHALIAPRPVGAST